MEILDRKQHVAGLRRRLLDPQEDIATDHRAGERRLGRSLPRNRLDLLAAAQHRDPVGDLEHLVQLVADEDDRLAVRLQAPNDLEQLVRLLGRQYRGRLVEDQDVGTAIERLQDLDPLFLAHRDVADERARINGQREALGELANALLGRALVQQQIVAWLDPEHDVLGDGHHRDQHEVLVDHPDPGSDRVSCRRELDPLAVQEELSGIGPVQAVEDVHQGRLAGAVLTEQRVHLTAAHIQIDVVVGHGARELLPDPAHLENEIVGHRGAS